MDTLIIALLMVAFTKPVLTHIQTQYFSFLWAWTIPIGGSVDTFRNNKLDLSFVFKLPAKRTPEMKLAPES